MHTSCDKVIVENNVLVIKGDQIMTVIRTIPENTILEILNIYIECHDSVFRTFNRSTRLVFPQKMKYLTQKIGSNIYVW